jgi:hypothetical protein
MVCVVRCLNKLILSERKLNLGSSICINPFQFGAIRFYLQSNHKSEQRKKDQSEHVFVISL